MSSQHRQADKPSGRSFASTTCHCKQPRTFSLETSCQQRKRSKKSFCHAPQTRHWSHHVCNFGESPSSQADTAATAKLRQLHFRVTRSGTAPDKMVKLSPANQARAETTFETLQTILRVGAIPMILYLGQCGLRGPCPAQLRTLVVAAPRCRRDWARSSPVASLSHASSHPVPFTACVGLRTGAEPRPSVLR